MCVCSTYLYALTHEYAICFFVFVLYFVFILLYSCAPVLNSYRKLHLNVMIFFFFFKKLYFAYCHVGVYVGVYLYMCVVRIRSDELRHRLSMALLASVAHTASARGSSQGRECNECVRSGAAAWVARIRGDSHGGSTGNQSAVRTPRGVRCRWPQRSGGARRRWCGRVSRHCSSTARVVQRARQCHLGSVCCLPIVYRSLLMSSSFSQLLCWKELQATHRQRRWRRMDVFAPASGSCIQIQISLCWWCHSELEAVCCCSSWSETECGCDHIMDSVCWWHKRMCECLLRFNLIESDIILKVPK